MAQKNDLFKRLTRLFRSGPIVKRKVRGFRTGEITSSALDVFRKSTTGVYGNALNAYGQYDRLCIDINTKIAIPGPEGFLTLKELIEKYPNGEKFIVYSYDHEKRCIVPAWAHTPRISGTKDTVKITFDNGKYLICTSDHPCMMRDGSYKDAENLSSGDSMMPFYRKRFEGKSDKDGKKFFGYRSILTFNRKDNNWNGWQSEHKLIAEWFFKRKIKKSEHVHHINFLSQDNNPENLQIMDAHDHLILHGKNTKEQWKNLEIRERMINGIKKAWERDDGSRAKNVAKNNSREDVIKKRREFLLKNNPTNLSEIRDKISKKAKQRKNKNFDLVCSFENLISVFGYGCTLNQKEASEILDINPLTLCKYLKKQGYESWSDFKQKELRLNNHKVVSVEKFNQLEVGDLTVDGYENFATDSIIVHNSRYSDFCVRGDTKIYTTNGIFTIKELSEKYKNGERFHVYSYDHENNKIVIAEAHSPRLSRNGEKQKLVRVHFDGGHIDSTLDHKFLLRGGDYVQAKDLKSGMALMPFTIKKLDSNGYKYIYTMEKYGGWQREHRFVIEHFVRKIEDNEVVHHIDFDKDNNKLENLMIMDRIEHYKYHAQLNNKNKFGKPNNKHSKWMRENNPSKRTDITFEKILELAIELNFVMSKVKKALKVDQNVIKRRLRERGFKNWVDFKSKRNEIQQHITDNNIIKESTSPEIEDIIEKSKDCQNIYELCQKLSCTPNAIRRRIFSHGYGTWSNLKEDNGFSVVEGVGRKELIDQSISYQDICNSYKEGMTYRELASTVGTSQNKILARIIKEGFRSYYDWVQNYNNHKVISVDFLDKKEMVYNLTVDKYHNFAAGSDCDLNYENFSCEPQKFVIIKNSEMEYTPEIASALQVHAEESVAPDEKGRSLHIFSENAKIKELLEELFYDTLNIEFVLLGWVRNLCKYGDFFIFIDVTDGYGVINAYPIPVNEIEREEGWDPNDPMSVRFRWVTVGNQVLQNWQVAHFRLQGNDAFLPYGSSILESARRIWRQLILIEDAMLVYRVIRAPERRVFYIDVAGIPPDDVPNVIENARTQLKSQEVIDKDTGRVDLRYNPWSVDIDYFIPIRGTEGGTRIDTLPGGTNTTAIDDVEYIQKKLFAALKVPKAYIGFDEQLCLHPDTKIPLLDGRELSIKEISEEYRNGIKNWVYSSDLQGNIKPGEIEWAGPTKTVNKLTEVVLDNGEKILCTENHPFLLRNGQYKRADEIMVGESLMPLYRKISSKEKGDKIEGYEQILQDGKWIYTHKLVFESTQNYKLPLNDRVIHHSSFNKRNNNPDLLVEMGKKEHFEYHANHFMTHIMGNPEIEERRRKNQLLWANSEKCHDLLRNIRVEEKSIKAHRKWLSSEDHKEMSSKQMKYETTTPGRPLYEWIHGDEISDVMSEVMKKNWEDSEYRKIKTKQNKEILQRPEVRAKIFGENHHSKRKYKTYTYDWLIGYCVENDLTHRDVFKYRDGRFDLVPPVGLRHVKTLLKENGFSGWRDFKKEILIPKLKEKTPNNHKVISVRDINLKFPIEVYDLTVKRWHNFATSSGNIVHNSSKANLAQEDVRFSRAIQAIQKVIISELNKIAAIHLAANGYDEEDLIDFKIALSNPSNTAQQQKLELVGRRFEIAQSKPENLLSNGYVYREVFNLTKEEIKKVEEEQIKDLQRQAILDQITEPGALGGEGGGGGLGGGGLGGGGGPGLEALGSGEEEIGGEEEGGLGGLGGEEGPGGGEEEGGEEEEEEDLFAGEEKNKKSLMLDIEEEDDEFDLDESEEEKVPVKRNPISQSQRVQYNRKRLKHGKGPYATSMPDLSRMNSLESDSYDANDERFEAEGPFHEINARTNRDVLDKMMFQQARMTKEIKKALNSMKKDLNINKRNILKESESRDVDDIEIIFEEEGEKKLDDLIVENELDHIIKEEKEEE